MGLHSNNTVIESQAAAAYDKWRKFERKWKRRFLIDPSNPSAILAQCPRLCLMCLQKTPAMVGLCPHNLWLQTARVEQWFEERTTPKIVKRIASFLLYEMDSLNGCVEYLE